MKILTLLLKLSEGIDYKMKRERKFMIKNHTVMGTIKAGRQAHLHSSRLYKMTLNAF